MKVHSSMFVLGKLERYALWLTCAMTSAGFAGHVVLAIVTDIVGRASLADWPSVER